MWGLVVNSSQTQACGVYQHALRMGKILCKNEGQIQWKYVELNSPDELRTCLNLRPDVVVYNYYPGPVLGFLPEMGLKSYYPHTKHLYLIHEFTPDMVNGPIPYGGEGLFDAVVCTDPSVQNQVNNSTWFSTVRPIPEPCEHMPCADDRVRVGSFGFSFNNKGFLRILDTVFENESHADVEFHFHLTDATFTGGYMANTAHAEVQEHLDQLNAQHGKHYKYCPTSDFVEDQEIVKRLARNTLNILAYDYNGGRGVSSATDYLVACGAPFALITESNQFRHVQNPGECDPYPMTGSQMLSLYSRTTKLKEAWSHTAFRADYERIVRTVCGK